MLRGECSAALELETVDIDAAELDGQSPRLWGSKVWNGIRWGSKWCVLGVVEPDAVEPIVAM